jgi:PAS domain S-box-containing protein
MHERTLEHVDGDPVARGPRSGYRILLIEDDPDHRMLEIQALRERLGSAAVIEAVATAAEGLEAIERESFDVVLADYRMPGMDGVEFLRTLNARGCDVPVILVTGLGNERVAVEALKHGAADYVIKEAKYWELLPSIVERTIRATHVKRRIEEARRRTEILHELAQEMGRTLDLSELLQILVRKSVELLRVERATVLLPDRDLETIAEVVTYDVNPRPEDPTPSLKGRRIAEFPIWQTWSATPEPLIIPDATGGDLLPREVIHALDIRAVLGLLLRAKGKPVAALFLSTRRPHEFTPEDVIYARVLAEHASIALENAHLYQEIQQRLFELNGLYEIACLLGKVRNPRDVYGELTALIARLIGATRCIIATYDPRTRELRTESPGYGVDNTRVQASTYVVTEELRAFWNLRTHGPFIANRREEIPDSLQRFVAEFAVENLLAVAMLTEGRTVGVIYAMNKPGGFTPEDGRLLGIFANQAAQVIERACLYEKIARSEEKYRSLFENAIVGIYRSTPGGHVLMANPTLARLLGCRNVEEVLVTPAEEMWADPRERECWREQVEQRGIYENEHRIRTRDGRIRWVYDIARAVRDAEGRVLYYEGALVDITEQKRASAEREAMLEITQGATTGADLNELFSLIHRALKKVLPAENFFIALYDARTGYFHFPYFADQYDPPPPPLRLEKTATAYVFRTGRPLRLTQERCRELTEQGEMELVGTPSACWIGVPLRTPRETIGVLVVQHYEDERAYTDRDVEFLASVGNHVAVLIERKRAEEALYRSQRRYRHLVESVTDLVLSLDRECRITYINPAAESILGYAPEELVGEPIGRLIYPEDHAAVEAVCESRRLGQAPPTSCACRLVAKDGTLRYVQGLVHYATSEEEDAETVVILRDVTEERRAQQRLVRVHDLVTRFHRQDLFDHAVRELAHLFDVEYALVGVLDDDGTRVRALAFYEEGNLRHDLSYALRGTPCENVMEKAEWCAYSPRAWERFPEDEILATLGIESYIGAPILDSVGKVLGVVTAFGKQPRTFTEADAYVLQIIGQRVGNEIERLREEEARLKLQEQLYQAQKMESVGTLAGGIAHDFNNILTGMMGFAELALMEAGYSTRSPDRVGAPAGSPPAIAEYLRHVLSLGARARDLVRRLLLFSRPSTGEREICDLRNLLGDLVVLLKRTLPENIEIEVQLPQEELFIEANRDHFQQVILNLAVNARDAMPHGGRLRLEAHSVDVEVPGPPHVRPGRFLRLTVSDTGHGIPPHILPHIFEPFFTTKEVGQGTGLGLSIVYGIIKAHGGWIDVESEVGRGTHVHLYVPLVTARPGAQEAPAEEEPRGGHETILLIEDEPIILELGRQMLQSLGYRVLTARDGQEGIALYTAWHSEIDLILLDVIMPRMSGHDTFYELRRINPKAKIVLITGYSPEQVAAELLAQGALGVIQKPYERRELARAVREALEA